MTVDLADSMMEGRLMKLAKISWWVSVVGLFLLPAAFVAVAGGLIARHRDPQCEWQPAVGLGALGVAASLAVISLLVSGGVL
jgi:hypothetical protein